MRIPKGERPARTPEQRQCEQRLWERLAVELDKLRDTTVRLVRGATVVAKAAEPGTLRWTAQEEFYLDRAVNEYLEAATGGRAAMRSPQEYAVETNDAILPQEARLAYQAGIGLGAQVAGEEVASVTELARVRAERAFLRDRYAMLSKNGWACLSRVLEQDDPPGVTLLIRRGMADGRNSIEVARDISRRYDEYKRWEFARLARTETAFALNAAAGQELEAAGYTTIPQFDEWPPYHPNCRCSRTVNDGYQFPSVSALACWVCQAKLVQARGALDAALSKRQEAPNGLQA